MTAVERLLRTSHPGTRAGSAGERTAWDLVVFPCAGAGPAAFHGWPRLLPPDWRLTTVTLPGREASYGEPFATDMTALAGDVVSALGDLRSADSTVPLMLFGHSMGGRLAHLVASRLPTDALVTAACPPPERPARATARVTPDEQELRAEIAAVLTAVSPVDDDVLDELTAMSAPVLAADIELLATFRPPPLPVDCVITALYGADDPMDPVPWTGETTSTATCVVLPGSHFFVQEAPDRVIDELRQCAARTSGAPR